MRLIVHGLAAVGIAAVSILAAHASPERAWVAGWVGGVLCGAVVRGIWREK